jgi:hypothetical protein
VRKKVKWPIVHLFMKKLMHIDECFYQRQRKRFEKTRGIG